MAVNNLDLDVKFWDLGPGWQLYPIQPLSLDLYRQKYAKTPVRFRFFKSYDRLNQHMYEHSRFFHLLQNRTTGADFVINIAYLRRILGLCEISDIPRSPNWWTLW